MVALAIVSTVVFFVCAGVILLVAARSVTQKNQNTLPTIDEAKVQIAIQYPDHGDCFVLTQKVTESVSGGWGTAVHFYGHFLVCKELGVSIQVRLDEQKVSL